jgi:hypothetical protein
MPQTIDRSTLLSYFETRKKPTQAQYEGLINTAVLFEAEASSSQNTILMDFINEKSSGVGVTIESVTINDGAVAAPNGFAGVLTGSVVGNVIGDVTAATIGVDDLTVNNTSALGSAIVGSLTAQFASGGDTNTTILTSSGVSISKAFNTGIASNWDLGFESLALTYDETATTGKTRTTSLTNQSAVELKELLGGGAYSESKLDHLGMSFGTSGGTSEKLRFTTVEVTANDFISSGSGDWVATYTLDGNSSDFGFITPSVWNPTRAAWSSPVNGAIVGTNWEFHYMSSILTVRVDVLPIPGNPAWDAKVMIWHEGGQY